MKRHFNRIKTIRKSDILFWFGEAQYKIPMVFYYKKSLELCPKIAATAAAHSHAYRHSGKKQIKHGQRLNDEEKRCVVCSYVCAQGILFGFKWLSFKYMCISIIALRQSNAINIHIRTQTHKLSISYAIFTRLHSIPSGN